MLFTVLIASFRRSPPPTIADCGTTYFLRMLMNSFSLDVSSVLVSTAVEVGGVVKFGVVGLVVGVTVPEE